MWVLIKREKNCIIKETKKAICCRVQHIDNTFSNVWLPKYAINNKSLKGYLCIYENMAIEKNIKFESLIRTPKILNPNRANICNEFDD
ncbi:MAG TPA: hypothetical protein PLU58_08540 [Saprospiraceae bacterium]|jgi:hypothetical protein|nr:hypothetical protein [Saprospiraceae bacterium]